MKQTKPQPGNRKSAAQSAPSDAPHVQGEGDYEAAREYRKDVKAFIDSGKVDEAARAARPANAGEAQEMQQAEDAGKARAREEDRLLRKREH